jgi:hypothetical protein
MHIRIIKHEAMNANARNALALDFRRSNNQDLCPGLSFRYTQGPTQESLGDGAGEALHSKIFNRILLANAMT